MNEPTNRGHCLTHPHSPTWTLGPHVHVAGGLEGRQAQTLGSLGEMQLRRCRLSSGEPSRGSASRRSCPDCQVVFPRWGPLYGPLAMSRPGGLATGVCSCEPHTDQYPQLFSCLGKGPKLQA